MALSDIRIVLVNTSHSGNIGSVARAMKTMGLSQLILVDPACEIDSHASALAAGATDVLGKSKTVATLAEAIADCALTIGTSARSRTLSWPMVEPRECAQKLVLGSQHGPVALVFGRENSGLSNEELQLCNYHVCIPANPEYSSLNLAMAVMTLCYETRMAQLDLQDKPVVEDETRYPSAQQMELFYEHLEHTLNETGFIIKQHPGIVMTRLRRLFNRARPEDQELNILRGILTSINRSTDKTDK
ncbi:tRNA (cytosine(32)/uridine(32)-2'-O)-methyltransferase TrmJ [Pseudoalteromonas fenneropenaei]|uniref:tRNA (cytidine/uridine-2'-O-)-methyltransferase TrmJ n=1 Tax=Pseudoalteromonas fenneropenaei TaxID=1737459 RepID=A0ABV7CLW0_9GAMM